MLFLFHIMLFCVNVYIHIYNDKYLTISVNKLQTDDRTMYDYIVILNPIESKVFCHSIYVTAIYRFVLSTFVGFTLKKKLRRQMKMHLWHEAPCREYLITKPKDKYLSE